MPNKLLQIKTFKNSFKLIYFRYPKLNSVSLNLKIKAGSIYEQHNQIGASHFTEHMVLTGTHKYPTQESLKSLVLNNGGKIISSTSREEVMFYIKVLKKDLKKGLEFLSQIIQKPLFKESEITKQKEIIKHEIKRSMDNPEKAIYRWNNKILFPNHRLGKLNTGDFSDIDRININTIREFFSQNYQAQNMTLGICGDLDNLEEVSEYFEDVSNINNNMFPDLSVNLNFDSQILNNNKLNQAHIYISFYGFPRFSKEDYILKYISQALAGDSISVLPYLVRTSKGFAYKIISESFSAERFGIFSIYTACDENNIENVLDLIKNGIFYLSNNLLDKNQFERAKNSLVADMIFSFEKPSIIADYYATVGIYNNTKHTHYSEIEALKKITREDILNISKILFHQLPKVTIIAPTFKNKIIWNF